MQTIDLIRFLQNYYGIYHQSLKFEKLSHDDIKALFPFVRTCQKGYINLEDLQNGNILGVYDKNSKIVFYLNPHVKLDGLRIPEIEPAPENEEIKELILDELEGLSKDELLTIRRRLRLENRRRESYKLNSYIRKIKEQEPRNYREKKLKLLMEENYYD